MTADSRYLQAQADHMSRNWDDGFELGLELALAAAGLLAVIAWTIRKGFG